MAVLLTAGAAFAFTYSTSVGTNTKPISFGGITGTYGYEGAATGGSNQASGIYGHHCTGASCGPSSQPFNSVSNILMVTATWQAINGLGPFGVEMVAQITNKNGNLTCQDETLPQCGPSPNYVDSCWVTMTEGAPGATGGTTNMGWPDSMLQNGIHHPPSTNQNYSSADGQPTTTNDSWVINLDDPNTLTYTCSSNVVTGFNGTA